MTALDEAEFELEQVLETNVRHRVLMVSAAFPPTGGSGVQRTVKFAKYLSRYGWQPTVWTVDRYDGLPKDASLLCDIGAEVTVCRWNRGRRARLLQRSMCATRIGNLLVPRVVAAVDRRLENWLSNCPFPDEFAGWARASVSPLRRLVKSQGIDVIYSTYSPASNHQLAMKLKSQTGLPWVADFRDLWTEDFRYQERSASRQAADRRLEQQVLDEADIVIGVTPSQTNLLADRVPTCRRKFRTITNGYDPDDFRRVDRAETSGDRPFVLSFVGRFERSRAPRVLLAGLRRFVDSLGSDRDRFLFRVIGHADRYTRSSLAASGIPHVLTGYVSHAEAVREMASADALLLSTEAKLRNAKTVICAKLFEYLASCRPILVVGPSGGECERIVRSCNAGLAVTPQESDISDALSRFYQARQCGRPISGCDPDRLSRYSRVTLTRRLAAILDGLVRQSPEEYSSSRGRRAGTLAVACTT